MNSKAQKLLGFRVDKLTNSIENVFTGEIFPTEVALLSKMEIRNITKLNGWQFSWRQEFRKPDAEIYKLTTVNNPGIIQGLVSFTLKSDHVFMNLIENAPFNQGKKKIYAGVMGNLVAFGCRLSFQLGKGGYLSFLSKTRLISHYTESIGAIHFGGHLMVMTPENSLKLIGKYFKD